MAVFGSCRVYILFRVSLLLLIVAGCNADSKMAKVCVANFLQLDQTITVDLNSTSSHFSFRVPHGEESAFTMVTLPDENGPESYFEIILGRTKNLSELLFLNSFAPNNTEYTVSIYGNVTVPQCWINKSSSNQVLPKLRIDRALVRLTNPYSFPVYFSQRSDNCYKCCDYPLGVLYPNEKQFITVDTTFTLTLIFNKSENGSTINFNSLYHCNERNNSLTTICCTHRHFKEHYFYSISLKPDLATADANNSCQCQADILDINAGDNAYLPLLYASVAIIGASVIWVLLLFGYRCINERGYLHYLHINRVDRVAARDLGSPRSVSKSYGPSSPEEREPLDKQKDGSLNSSGLVARGTTGDVELEEVVEKPKKRRLKSLDAFRGLSLTIMIFVNYGGGGYWFFNHSRWNGLTVADLVFPWFVWIMGVSIVFSFKGRRKDSIVARLYQVVRRSLILFGLGIFLNNGYQLSHWRIPGVLQRFGISYFVVALTELITSELYNRRKFTVWEPLRDITNNWVQWVAVLVLEFLWLMLTFLLPLPHQCPRGYLGPGGLAEMGNYENCTGGAALVIDRWLFHENHIYQHPTAKDLYKTGPYEPEGLLGSLNSIIICYLGVQAGRILVHYRGHTSVLVRFVVWGVALGVLGTILCEGQKNEGVIPINKNLWSFSFILVMAGTGFLLLALFYLLIDVIHWWNGSPFRYPGMNSIVVYVGSELLQGYFPFSWQGQNDSHLKLLAANLVAVSIWLVISFYWYCIGFFVKI